ncbi:beta-ketoacyl-ACP synthase II [Rufibacter psychrotolerans]|uniref:beta-ketoacyl-ACP synthase II n=1 Tax=Rufibacter psychrotolerans TaxID=2812556 RepID=UPI0019680C3F|nr:beta-ketoacyl-ACP synthase II [Rufibacter sp. SYSU D00308]
MQLKRVVITGMGALTPIGNNLAEYRKGLFEGQSGAGNITRFDTTRYKTKFACEVKGYYPLAHFDKKSARKTDLFCQYALVVADEALAHSGLLESTVNRQRVGVIWSTGMGGMISFQEEVLNLAANHMNPRFNPFFITKIIGDISSGMISIKHGFQGVNFNTVSACASSSHAIIDAYNYIRLGKADAIVTGGSEAVVTETGIGGFSAIKALSQNNASPATASRPFDQNRDGFVLGEGAGALVLEELEHALSRGATILAEVIGGGVSADAYHITATHPEGAGALLGMQDALNEAGITADDVDYLNPHATSTPLGDESEAKAIERLFGESFGKVAISATKSMTGHLLGAAGAAEAIACVLAIQENKVPPTINCETLDPEINPSFPLVRDKALAKTIDIAMSNTFGFGGHNATLVLRRYQA